MTSQRDFAQMAFETLAHAVAGEVHEAADKLTDIATTATINEMYGVCCGFAEAGTIMLRKLYGNPEPGTMWAIEQIKPGALDDDPVEAFSARFLVAHANGDSDTTLAMWGALLTSNPETYTDSVTTLVCDVAGICRLAIDQKRTGS